MKKFSFLELCSLLTAIMLVLCLFAMPYGFYTLVRFLVAVLMGFLAYHFYQQKANMMAIGAGILLILFQPIWKIALGRTIWNLLDIVLAIALVVWVIYQHKHSRED